MKIRIGVFFGGNSVEHEVSVISAIQAIKSLDTAKYEPVPVYITRKGEFYTGECMARIEEYRDTAALLKKSSRVMPINDGGRVLLSLYPAPRFGKRDLGAIDLALPVVHGTNVEDGALQGFFRTLSLPFVGCEVLASAVGMDKFVMKTLFRERGLPVLDCVRFDVKRFGRESERILDEIGERLGYPVIVKPADLGSSVGIEVASSREELESAIEDAFTFAPVLLCERCVKKLREINCSVLGDYESARASECEEPLSGGDILSYEDKYISGGKGGSKGMTSLKRLLPAPISEELRERVRSLAVEAFHAIGASGVARIDFLLDGESGELFVNEINTIPGSLSFYLWEPLGLKYRALLDELVALALKREREKGEFSYSIETGILQNFTGGAKGSKSPKG